MSGELRQEDVERLMSCCAEIYRWDGQVPFAEHVIGVLPKLLESAVVVYQSFDFETKTTEMHLSGMQAEIAKHQEAFFKYMHQHPLINHARETGATWSLRITDVQPWEAFRETGLYREFYKKIGLGHQMAASLPARRGDVLGIAYSKEDGAANFTDREKMMLDMLRMHVLQAKQLSRKFGAILEFARRAHGMLESLEEGVVGLDGMLRVRQRTKRAREVMERHFGKVAPRELPGEVMGWVRSQVLREKGVWHTRYATILETSRGSLKLRLMPREGEWVLLVEEAAGLREKISMEPLLGLGLTKREAEVLMWVSQGKSNPEIGIIVGAKARTVQKHIERILKKLGVENRQAAGMRALEMMM
ncbi:MAG: response regulator transcription factor [Phycisphaerae bacterium]